MPSNLNYRPLTKPKPAAGRVGAQESLNSPAVRSLGRILFYYCIAWLLISFLCTLGGADIAGPKLASWRKSLFSSTYSRPDSNSFCDPYSLPGFVFSRDGTADGTISPLSVWRTYDSSCESTNYLPSLLSTLPKSPYHAVTSRGNFGSATQATRIAQNKTILLVGDQVDKSLVENFCSLTGGKIESVDGSHPWAKAALAGADPHTSTTYQLAHYCYVPTHE